MELCSAAQICPRVTNALAYKYRTLDFDFIDCLEYFARTEIPQRAFIAFAELKYVFVGCGIEESVHKAVPPSTRVELLGIICDMTYLTLKS